MIYVAKEYKQYCSNLKPYPYDIYFRPTKIQRKIILDNTRFKILDAGRRFSKSYTLLGDCIKNAWEKKNSLNCLISPIYAQVLDLARKLNAILPPSKIRGRYPRKYHQELAEGNEEKNHFIDYRDIQLINGSIIKFKTAVHPKRIKGEGYDWVGINEAGEISDELWNEVIRPSLMDKEGKVFIEGTPNGKNWFYYVWLKGQEDDEPDYISWVYNSLEGGFITEEEFEEARRNTPERTFRQEYLGEFVDNSNNVFHELEKNIVGNYDWSSYQGTGYIVDVEPNPNHHYIIGVDIGKQVSYTVISVMNRNTCHLDAFWRFRHKSFEDIYQAIISMYKYYKHCEIYPDSTGIGAPLAERLSKFTRDAVFPYYFTNKSLQELMDSLQLKIENRIVTFPNIPILLKEMKMIEYEILPSRLTTYKAPSGFYTDCVMSLALSCVGIESWEYEKLIGKLA
jgi:hypothetical protein